MLDWLSLAARPTGKGKGGRVRALEVWSCGLRNEKFRTLNVN